jgi:hypothetical protein
MRPVFLRFFPTSLYAIRQAYRIAVGSALIILLLTIPSGSQCNPIPQSATPATRDYFLIKGNQRKKRRTKLRPSQKKIIEKPPLPSGDTFLG